MPASGSSSTTQLSNIEKKIQSKTNGISIKRAKSFNSTSAPSSPSALRRNKQPTLEPRYNKSTHLLIEFKRIGKELDERKKKGNPILRPQSAKTMNFASRFRSGSSGTNNGTKMKRPNTTDNMVRGQSPASFDGRMTPLRNSGRKRSYIVPTTSSKSCYECQKTLKSGFYSEHGGFSYCNVPCYSSLFSSLLNRDNDELDGCSTLSEDQKQFRASVIPKLRIYNTYYSEKSCQISCREINDKFILEGVIKVYWGIQSPVTLADSEVSHYWKHFQPDDGTHRDNEENIPPPKVLNFGGKSKHRHDASKYKYQRKISSPSNASSLTSSIEAQQQPRRRLGCSVCKNELHNSDNMTSFVPPYGIPTTLRLTNHMTVPNVIDNLLKKFQIRDSRKRFTLFTVYESGGQRRLKNDSFPLLTRLNLGPCEDVAKLYIMDAADQTEITLEVAQYINFNASVLETFVQKFHEEEEREVERIKEKYKDYKELLMKRILEFERNNNCLTKEE